MRVYVITNAASLAQSDALFAMSCRQAMLHHTHSYSASASQLRVMKHRRIGSCHTVGCSLACINNAPQGCRQQLVVVQILTRVADSRGFCLTSVIRICRSSSCEACQMLTLTLGVKFRYVITAWHYRSSAPCVERDWKDWALAD